MGEGTEPTWDQAVELGHDLFATLEDAEPALAAIGEWIDTQLVPLGLDGEGDPVLRNEVEATAGTVVAALATGAGDGVGGLRGGGVEGVYRGQKVLAARRRATGRDR